MNVADLEMHNLHSELARILCAEQLCNYPCQKGNSEILLLQIYPLRIEAFGGDWVKYVISRGIIRFQVNFGDFVDFLKDRRDFSGWF